MASTHWQIDTVHSSIGFTVRHLVIAKVHGRFTRWSGKLEWNADDPIRSTVYVRIEAKSIDTSDAERDAHLTSADFLDAESFPELTFMSRHVERLDDQRYRVRGDLAIRGTVRQATLEVEALGRAKDPWGGERMAFSGRTTLQRGDFGLKWNQALEAGGLLVGEKVEISFDAQAVKQSAQQGA
jgi:polyisoprenoid-binding protein YceI